MKLLSAEISSTKWTYSYDQRGNITAKTKKDLATDETVTDSYVYDTKWEDKLTSYNGQSITYDAVGNPVEYLGNTLTWSMGRQLVTFGNNTYTYNEDGIRTSKTVGNALTTFYLDSANIIEQITGNTVLHFYYDSYNEIIGFEYGDNNYYYVKNAMSDVIGISDATGNLIASYSYDTWGKVTSVIGSNAAIGELNPFRYRSYYYDSDIGMYYLQSRYYDADVGRFINLDEAKYYSRDGKNISYNSYLYCDNNPINYIDALGKSKVNYLRNVFSNYNNGKYSLLKLFAKLVSKNGKNEYTGFHEFAQIIVGNKLKCKGYNVILEYKCSDNKHEIDIYASKRVKRKNKQYMWEVKPNTRQGSIGAENQLALYQRLNPEIARGFYMNDIKVEICDGLKMEISFNKRGGAFYSFHGKNDEYISNSELRSRIRNEVATVSISIGITAIMIAAIVAVLSQGTAAPAVAPVTATVSSVSTETIIIIVLPELFKVVA